MYMHVYCKIVIYQLMCTLFTSMAAFLQHLHANKTLSHLLKLKNKSLNNITGGIFSHFPQPNQGKQKETKKKGRKKQNPVKLLSVKASIFLKTCLWPSLF